jgi:hypothetical protein
MFRAADNLKWPGLEAGAIDLEAHPFLIQNLARRSAGADRKEAL